MQVAAWCLGAVTACSGRVDEREQWLVRVHTDLPVPRLGNRLLVEVLAEDGSALCSDCSRVFGAVEEGTFPLSFGVPRSAPRVRLRMRLHRTAALDAAGLPPVPSTIDRVVVLEVLGVGKQSIDVNLLTECIGVATDLAARTSCSRGAELSPEASLSAPEAPVANGSWSGAARVPCAGAEREDMSCIPGGAFLLGEPSAGLPPALDTSPEHLVQISPFRLDVRELTVGAARALLPKVPDIALEAKSEARPDCTYLGGTDSTHDGLPLNCLSRVQAQRLCAAAGKRLPTQAEWEYAASNTTAETPYPWGAAPPSCARAATGRAALYLYETGMDGDSSCRLDRGNALPAGPREASRAPCSLLDDCTEAGVRDLGGNVKEWVADAFSPYALGCWAKPGVLLDPRCEGGKNLTVRGASWVDVPSAGRSTARNEVTDDGFGVLVGARCAVDAR
jgi:formylglycine-generating enzyme